MAQAQVTFIFEVDWDFDDTYTDETSKVISVNGSMSAHSGASSSTSGRGIMSSMTVVLDNSDDLPRALPATDHHRRHDAGYQRCAVCWGDQAACGAGAHGAHRRHHHAAMRES